VGVETGAIDEHRYVTIEPPAPNTASDAPISAQSKGIMKQDQQGPCQRVIPQEADR
jgi:hypothetical protein